MNTTRSYTMSARADGVAETRARIARGAMDLFLAQPYEEVTLAAIAKAAGVSHQTVLNHFESKEGVALAAAAIISEDTVAARATGRRGDLSSTVRALVGEYERFGDANFRWAASADRLDALAAMLEEGRRGHRAWLIDQFGARLPTGGAAHDRAVAALYAVTDVYTWKLLRRDLHMSRADTERVVTDMVTAVLDTFDTKPRRAGKER
jgi:AcrR family transcriptional regulator